MSTTIIESFSYLIQQITIYVGSILFIFGLIGNILNVIVFSSLRTFRQSSCTFYLTIMSFFNIGDLVVGVLPRIISMVHETDSTNDSLFYCKFRYCFTTICVTVSLTCFCLATIDQYCATNSRPHFQQLCTIKLARRLVTFFIIFWTLHAIPYLFLYYHTISPNTNKTICIMTNVIYIKYRLYVIALMFYGILPISVSIVFAILAYRNLKQMPHYTIPLVRRELDKQLTIMVLTQVMIDSLVIIPFISMYVVLLNTTMINDSIIQSYIQLIYNITFALSYGYYSSPLYVYMCVSERFRRQLIYVLFKIYFTCCKKPVRRGQINQIQPLASN